ncbi:MAG: hypothetical protein NC395_03040 [Prevotella sp.]|nr:hypothetical protein [Prevotella sp.]
MKKFLSFVLCAVMAFSVISGIVFAESPADISVVSEAAEYNKTMLPYCYRKLTSEEKLAYLKMRTAFIECRSAVRIEIPTETADKLARIMMDADVLTSFNFPVGDDVVEYYYYEDTGLTIMIMFQYNYDKKEYDRIMKESEKAAKKVISGFTDQMTDYEKIKYIHDYIITNTEYQSGSSTNSIYDSLVNGKAKCDGYAHAFDYLCAKAGIRSATVTGYAESGGEREYHAWNKVYWNKKWYNVDVTWDDNESNVKNNIPYNYFMLSDETIGKDHFQSEEDYYIPSASSDDGEYYRKNGLYASTVNETKNILAEKIAEAAKNKRNSVTVRLKDKELFDEVMKRFEETDELFDVMDRARQKSGGRILTDGYSYQGSEDAIYTYTVFFYFPNSKLSDYFIDLEKVDDDTVSFLEDMGIKNE